jgi:ketosteroid isomerase-like protein
VHHIAPAWLKFYTEILVFINQIQKPTKSNIYKPNSINLKIKRKMKKILYLMLLVLMIIAACQPKTKTVNLRADADTIRNLENQWTTAIQNDDKEKMLSFPSLDAIYMIPDQPSVIGLQNIRKFVESDIADTLWIRKSFKTKIDTIEVAASRELAYVRGINQYDLKTSKGLVNVQEKWVDIWKKTDGQWKDIVCIRNTSKK